MVIFIAYTAFHWPLLKIYLIVKSVLSNLRAELVCRLHYKCHRIHCSRSPLEQQIGQFFYIGLAGTELDAEARALIQEVQPGGVIIFGRNVATPQQLRRIAGRRA